MQAQVTTDDVEAIDVQRAGCPRCGYDQRGVMATWVQVSPLDGICTECGLNFAWAEVLSTKISLPRWCVEAPRTWLSFPFQFLRTAMRCWWPPLLWKRLQMTHPRRWSRLAIWLTLWCALAIASVMCSNGIMAVSRWYQMTTGTFMRTAPATASTGPGPVFLQAALLPLSSQSIGTYTVPGWPAMAYMAPIEHVHWVVDDQWQPALLLLAIPIATSLTFAALPISRRRARVRASHVVRGLIYAYAIIFPILALMPLQWTLVMSFARVSDSMMRSATTIVSLLLGTISVASLPAFLIFWWSCAKHYLRMQHAWAIAFSVTVIGCLAPFSVSGAIWYWFS